jgi:hypothetical protein
MNSEAINWIVFVVLFGCLIGFDIVAVMLWDDAVRQALKGKLLFKPRSWSVFAKKVGYVIAVWLAARLLFPPISHPPIYMFVILYSLACIGTMYMDSYARYERVR